MRKLNCRPQRTISRPALVRGVGYLSGKDITLRFQPAPVNTGVVFLRTDLPARVPLPARVDRVTGTNRRTTLGENSASVALVEHVLSALAGLRIDNCIVELDGPEPPGLDGSAQAFVKALHGSGVEVQSAQREVWTVRTPLVVGKGGATLSLYPAVKDELRITYLLDYGPDAPLQPQRHTSTVTPETFAHNIAGCRTFLLEQEARELIRQGFGKRTALSDLLVFGPDGVIANTLRFADEPARHKVLDILGDLALSGLDLRGHVVAYRSGHPLNVELVKEIHHRMAPALPRRRAA